ncbi:MAG TPA: YHYH protein [Bacteroidia bacterium]|nr:YHYH protein [Bacteroidia bacterium]
MFKKLLSLQLLLISISSMAQLNPAITSFLQNTTVTGTYYVSGNSIAQSNGILVNCQTVEYSTTGVYVHTTGVPAYPTGPFLDGNPSNATNQNAIFKIPFAPTQNTGTATATTGGNIGIFINGVALFDYRDGVAWNATTNALCGGPGNPPCPGGPQATQAWNRDAVRAERPGFDCSKAHPAQGNYHHHQNPSAFKLDLNVVSTICNLYDADGLYAIDSTQHSPLIGYAYDGFPIYGAYAYTNSNGTGGITRMKSGYQLRNITTRTTSPTGATVTAGPVVSTTYPLGYFREDYEFIAHPGQEDYLDEHNGRFCITPEYPNGIYCYFCTVDSNWNSTYPYAVGPTFYGVYANRKVTSVTEPTTVYTPTTGISNVNSNDFKANIFPNPTNDFIAVQVMGLNKENLKVELFDEAGKLIQTSSITAGATNTYLDTRTLYSGNYLVKISGGSEGSRTQTLTTKKVVVQK